MRKPSLIVVKISENRQTLNSIFFPANKWKQRIDKSDWPAVVHSIDRRFHFVVDLRFIHCFIPKQLSLGLIFLQTTSLPFVSMKRSPISTYQVTVTGVLFWKYVLFKKHMSLLLVAPPICHHINFPSDVIYVFPY